MDPDLSRQSADRGLASEDLARSSTETTVSGPLSWEEARSTLRRVMEKYMETPLPVVKSTNAPSNQTTKWWQCMFQWDVDFYSGAAVSAALLGLSAASLATRKRGHVGMDAVLNAAASLTIYRAQVAASTLLLVGSFFCIFLVKRREYTFAHDSDVSKRKIITKFLTATHEQSDGTTSSEKNIYGDESGRCKGDKHPTGKVQQLHHSGTSRTGIYPAYRRSECTNQQEAYWYRIPTLLLVKGDYIALQVGDVAPARCKLMNPDSQSTTTSSPCIIEGGETITVTSFGDLWGLSPSLKFPPGKSTVPSDSRQLLELCNQKRVFVLEETPLESFLKLPNGKCYGGHKLSVLGLLRYSLVYSPRQQSRDYHRFIDN